MLKIAVCAKQVPDTDIPPSQFKVDEGALRVIPPAGVPPIVNGFDMNAVEAALRLRDAGVECEIVIFSVGTEFALDVMKKPLAIGADRLVLVDDEASESLDALGTARVLAAAIERDGGADLVLAGRQASDWDQAHVPIMLSEIMSAPLVTLVRNLAMNGGGESFEVERVAEGGFQRIECPIPAVMTVTNELGEARYANLRGIMAATRKQPETMTIADLGIGDVANNGKLEMTRLFVPISESNVEFIEGEDEADSGRLLALRLREAKLI
ncbi:MAG: electron transfer flavoprotein subunit beta/FixA family protein [Chloroflexi bacterium]|nr:electron transfer flavoprotein subunit beta/FixA family protein [Chloroflexota bacterium]